MLRILVEDIEATTASARLFKSSHWVSSFDSWRRRYLLIVQLVHQMSRYFGFFLLVIITTEFVRMTSTTFFLLMDYQSNNWKATTILMTFDFVKETTSFIILVYIPSRIQQEVNSLLSHTINYKLYFN